MKYSNVFIKQYIDTLYNRMFTLKNKDVKFSYAQLYANEVDVESSDFSWKTYIALLFYPFDLTGKTVAELTEYFDPESSVDQSKSLYMRAPHIFEVGAYSASQFITFMHELGVKDIPVDVLSLVSNYHVFENISEEGSVTQDFDALNFNFISAVVLSELLSEYTSSEDAKKGYQSYIQLLRDVASMYVEAKRNVIGGIELLSETIQDLDSAKKVIHASILKKMDSYASKVAKSKSNSTIIMVPGIPDIQTIQKVAENYSGKDKYAVVSSIQAMYDVAKRFGCPSNSLKNISDIYNFITGKHLWNNITDEMTKAIAENLSKGKTVYISRMFRNVWRIKKFVNQISKGTKDGQYSVDVKKNNIGIIYLTPTDPDKLDGFKVVLNDGSKVVYNISDKKNLVSVQYPYIPFVSVDSSLLNGSKSVIPIIDSISGDLDALALPSEWEVQLFDIDKDKIVESGQARFMTNQEFALSIGEAIERIENKKDNKELNAIIESGGIDVEL